MSFSISDMLQNYSKFTPVFPKLNVSHNVAWQLRLDGEISEESELQCFQKRKQEADLIFH